MINLNKLLCSKIHVHKDDQLQATYIILEYWPSYPCFQKGQDFIKVSDKRLPYINVCLKGFVPSPLQIEQLHSRWHQGNSLPPFTNVDLGVSVAVLSTELLVLSIYLDKVLEVHEVIPSKVLNLNMSFQRIWPDISEPLNPRSQQTPSLA